MPDMAFRTSVDLTANTAGIVTPNPFWLASAPPANSGAQIQRAFDHGWGGAVWKTLGVPIQNVSSRFGGVDVRGTKAVGFNNIELITDRPLEVNFREIYETKKKYPKHAVVVSLMVETREEWKDIIKRAIDAGADGLELNFGCPHGMCERGMGSAVGQEPKVNQEITSWAVEYSTVPVLVKLTPNVANIVPHGLAAQRGGAHGVSLINTIKSIIGIDLDLMVPFPKVGKHSTNGGYCGPAVKPITDYYAEHGESEHEDKNAVNVPDYPGDILPIDLDIVNVKGVRAPGAVDVHEYERRRGEGTDAVGHGRHLDRLLANFGG